jgi:hypothetical protein
MINWPRLENQDFIMVLDCNNPIPVLEQDVEGDFSYVYYGETNAGRLLSLVMIEGSDNARVITAGDLSSDQRRDYLQRRA